MKKIKYCLLALLCPLLSIAQTHTIQGKVLNEESQPLPAATIQVKNTNIQAITDAHGLFNINASTNDTLLVTAAGYHFIAHALTDYQFLTMILKRSITALDEVVLSTGYQNIPKERATGSFAVAGPEIINRSVAPQLLDRLNGLAPGILFDNRRPEDQNIQIRGLSTISSQITRPLIVLDNFPYEGDISSINPNDVQSITILRDAAAASIWGAKAGNGVIVITTKKAAVQKPRLALTFTSTAIPKPNIFSSQAMAVNDFISMEQFLFEKGYFNSDINNTTSRQVLSPVIEILALKRAGAITQQQADQQIELLRKTDLRRDLSAWLYQPVLQHQLATNLSGGNDMLRYLFTAGFDHQPSSLVGNEQRRISFRNNSIFKPLRNLKLEVNTYFTQTKGRNNNPGGHESYQMNAGRFLYPYARLADEQGNYLPVANRFRMPYIDTAGAGNLLDWYYRPLQELQLADNTTITAQLLANLALRYKLTNAINTEVSYQYTSLQTDNRQYNHPESFFSRDLVNQFTQVNGNSVKHIIPPGGILNTSSNQSLSHTARVLINFQKQWDQHELVAMVGGEIRERKEDILQNRIYGFNDQLLTHANVDYTNTYPMYGGVNFQRRIPSGYRIEKYLDRFVSAFANAAYNYKNKYTISGSIRKDASNLFGVNANQKGVPLWSAGAAWKLSAEPFYHVKFLPYLNFRATYGYSGNVNPTATALTTIRFISGQSYSPLPGAELNNMPNPHLRWEKVGMFNIAADFSFINNRFSGSIDYYIKKSVDVLSSTSIDPTSGANSIMANSAHIRGSGFDFMLSAKLLKTKHIEWASNLNISYATYRLTQYLFDRNTDGYTSDGNVIVPIEGYNPYLVVSNRWGGLDPTNGDPQGFLDGHLSTDYQAMQQQPLSQQVIHGSALPPVFGNWLQQFTWKQLSLSLNITGRFGHYFRRPVLNYSSLYNAYQGHAEFSQRWQQPGDENRTHVPSMPYPVNSRRESFYSRSSITVERAGHIRLHDIRLQYQLPVGKNRLPVASTQLFVYASRLNVLLYKANKTGIDPENPAEIYPPRAFTFGIRTNL